MKTRILSVFASLVIGILGVAPAFADSFTFSFTGQASGSGTITANPTATAGVFLINGITGTVTIAGMANTITSLLAPGSFDVANPPANDNRLFFPAALNPANPVAPGFLDLAGVSFFAGGSNFNVFYDGQNYQTFRPQDVNNININSFTVARSTAATPEPESLLMVGTGLLAGFGMLRRRFVRA